MNKDFFIQDWKTHAKSLRIFGPCFLGLCCVALLSACVTAPVENQGAPKSAISQIQQQRFLQGKALFKSKQYAEAVGLLLPLAQQGHIGAQYTVGYMYHYGYGLPRNEKESIRWIAVAAARGHLKAQQALSLINASHDKQGVLSTSAPRP